MLLKKGIASHKGRYFTYARERMQAVLID